MSDYLKLPPGRGVDGAVHTSPAQERAVGRVHDGVDCQFGDVALDDFNPLRPVPFRSAHRSLLSRLQKVPTAACVPKTKFLGM